MASYRARANRRGNPKATALGEIEKKKNKFRNTNTGYSWEEKSFTFGNLKSENRRAEERARDDYLRGKQKAAHEIVRDTWKKTMSGEFSAMDFKDSIVDQKTGISGISSPWVGNIGDSWGQFGGGYDKSLYNKYQATESTRKKKVAEKKLQPGAYEQTRGTVLEGINKNSAKKTLLGQY